MERKLKKIPKFKNNNEEHEFWAKHDATEYFDVSKFKSKTFNDYQVNILSSNFWIL